MSTYILIYMCKYICPRQTQSHPRVQLRNSLLIQPRLGCGSRAKQAASKLHFLLLSSCTQRHPSPIFSLSSSLLPAPVFKWVCVSSSLTSLLLSRHFSAMMSQLSKEGGRGARRLCCVCSSCLPTRAKRKKKGDKEIIAGVRLLTLTFPPNLLNVICLFLKI